MSIWKYTLLFLLIFSSCGKKKLVLKPVSFGAFEAFVNATGYVTDAEKYGWSIVQLDVYNYKKVDRATWRKPDGINSVHSSNLPVTQVSYNDALAYCEWAKKRLPTYDEYWNNIKDDKRIIVSENKLPISEIQEVNVVGNVWDITTTQNNKGDIRIAGGSLFCSKSTCHGTVEETALFVDKETGNIHIGFSIVEF